LAGWLVRTVFGSLAILSSGCGIAIPSAHSESKLSLLSINDDRSKVLATIGVPDAVRGARKLENGQTVQVDEYRLYEKDAAMFAAAMCIPTVTLACWIPPPNRTIPYWVQSIDGKLEKWGRAGDWRPDLTEDITIRQR
jgi:hypothetical protein